MAVKQVGTTTGDNVRKYVGFTGDTKPKVDSYGKALGNGSSFKELDAATKTVKGYYTFHDGEWYAL